MTPSTIDIKLLHPLGSLYYLGAWAVGILCNHLKWGLVGPYDDASITKYALGGAGLDIGHLLKARRKIFRIINM